VAPSEALVMLHWVMHAASHWCIRMAIKMASEPRDFFFIVN
jgi:hypothetical protein